MSDRLAIRQKIAIAIAAEFCIHEADNQTAYPCPECRDRADRIIDRIAAGLLDDLLKAKP